MSGERPPGAKNRSRFFIAAMAIVHPGGEENRMIAGLNQIAGVAAGATSALTGTGSLPTQGGGEKAAGGAPFSDLMGDAVGEVSRLEDDAQKAVVGLMTGSGVDVHQAMIATEKASMAFELSLAVRNKAVQAYQQVMSMQF
jgi:flagellar hook-basal body complex protein FliE